MSGLVNRPNDISLSRANQSQAKFKSAVGGNLLQSWVNLTIITMMLITVFSRLYSYQIKAYGVAANKPQNVIL